MYCPKCGCQNNENSSFCQKCGAQISAQPAQNSLFNAQAYPSMPLPSKKPAVRSSHPVINTIKNLGVSPLLLTAICIYTAFVLFDLFSSISALSLDNIASIAGTSVNEILGDFGYGGYGGYNSYSNYASPYSSYSSPTVISSMVFKALTPIIVLLRIPNLLLLTGLWITVFCAANRNSDTMSTAGLTTIKVRQILKMIAGILWTLYAVIGFITALPEKTELGGYYINSNVRDPFILTALVITGFVLLVVYYAKTVKAINTVKRSIQSGTAYENSCGFIVVMNYIFAVLNILAAIICLIPPFSIFIGSMSFSRILIAASDICFAIFLGNYNKSLRALQLKRSTQHFQQEFSSQQTQNIVNEYNTPEQAGISSAPSQTNGIN